MTTVTIYQFTLYDIVNDENRQSRRWGTDKGISSVGGVVLKETATEVDASEVNSKISGLTEIDFSPQTRNLGFQTFVKP